MAHEGGSASKKRHQVLARPSATDEAPLPLQLCGEDYTDRCPPHVHNFPGAEQPGSGTRPRGRQEAGVLRAHPESTTEPCSPATTADVLRPREPRRFCSRSLLLPPRPAPPPLARSSSEDALDPWAPGSSRGSRVPGSRAAGTATSPSTEYGAGLCRCSWGASPV